MTNLSVLSDIESWIYNPIFIKSITFIIAVIIISIITHFLKKATDHYIKDNESRYTMKKVIRFFAYLFITIVLVITFTEKLGYLSLSIGLLSAAIAFALQEVILSIAGWIYIITNEIYRTGDRIEISVTKGDVIDINILNTSIMEIGNWIQGDNYSGRIIKIPNSFVFKGSVSNYSQDFPFLWDEIIIPIHYNSDYDLVEKILLEVSNEVIGDYSQKSIIKWQHMVRKYLIENAVITPTVTRYANDNWVEYNLRYIVDYKSRRKTKSEITKKMLQKFNKVDGRIKIASTTVEVSNSEFQGMKNSKQAPKK